MKISKEDSNKLEQEIFILPAGWSVKPLYDKCPRCDFDLNQIPQALVDKINSDQAKNSSGKTECSFISRSKKTLAPYFLNLCSKWMVFPFTTTKKNTAKRNQQGRLTGKIGQQSGTSAKKNNSAE
ncbi:hypothetical protein [Yersinia alsatica]|uniref:hypothetical protein n=1 Tax=Yersinia alsatica TaxID=2890317 RepID=UPI0011AA965B|nr:hypothetical protein [Yersinia alsatica]